MNTKDWKMGHYPVKAAPKLTVESALEEIETFGHKEAARVLRKALDVQPD